MSGRITHKVIIEYLKTYVVAGGFSASTEVLKAGGDRWISAASLPRALSEHASASLDNSILLIG